VLVAPANLAVVKAELLDPGRPQHLHRSTPASPAGASGPSTASSSNKPSRPTCMARSTRACSALAAANHRRPGPSGWSTRAGSAHPARQAPPPPGPPTRRGVSMTCSSRCRSRTRHREVGGVGALAPAPLQQATLTQPIKHERQQPLSLAIGEQPRAELGEHQGIQARVTRSRPVLPVQPCSHRVGGLPIGAASTNTSTSRAGDHAGRPVPRTARRTAHQ